MTETRLLSEAKVRERYGVSSMTLYRWDRDPDLNFPKAKRIRGRKYRDAAELDAFDETRARDQFLEVS
jgi:predicted DNA-binding transcriptional regulator AlpA